MRAGHGDDRLVGGGDKRVRRRRAARLARLPPDFAGGEDGLAVRERHHPTLAGRHIQLQGAHTEARPQTRARAARDRQADEQQVQPVQPVYSLCKQVKGLCRALPSQDHQV